MNSQYAQNRVPARQANFHPGNLPINPLRTISAALRKGACDVAMNLSARSVCCPGPP